MHARSGFNSYQSRVRRNASGASVRASIGWKGSKGGVDLLRVGQRVIQRIQILADMFSKLSQDGPELVQSA